MTVSWCMMAAVAVSQQAVQPLVSTAWLAEHLNDPSVVVIQVDSRPDLYHQGHIPGARLLSYGSFAVDGGGLGSELPPVATLDSVMEAAGIGDDTHVVIYSVGRVILATRLWFTLDYLGHGSRASLLDGGLARWRAEGRPVSTDAATGPPAAFTPRPRPEILASAEWISQRLGDPALALIDARPDDEYTGSDGGMGGRVHPGHIPGAYQLYWEKLVEAADRPTFLPLPELRRQFEAGGAGADKTVVTYCMVGMRASLTYFVGRMLGYDMKFYDGSWHEWGGKDLPYVTGSAPRD
ncbi:MAG TPA: sulfurtransferase [Gemmatimonadales bacterium]|nr:sulfurtransferase [Gemmatimonadales bacterium]